MKIFLKGEGYGRKITRVTTRIREKTEDSTKCLNGSMSLLKYFKPKDGLPDPNRPLSQSLPSRIIAAANSEVR